MRKRRAPKKPVRIVGSEPGTLAAWAARHIEWACTRNYAARTIEDRTRNLNLFIAWARDRDISRPVEVTRPILERYLRFLFNLRLENGRPMSFAAQLNRIASVRSLFKWLAKENAILSNPASDLDLPRTERRLPKHVLTVGEVERVLAEPDVGESYGLRDRAILELFYSTAMRRFELAGLAVFDLDLDRGTLLIRQGKGRKDRMVPVGERALAWLERYLNEVRPSLVVPPDPGFIFLSMLGGPLELGYLSQIVRDYVRAADLGKRGSCHLFRHTAATLMLENGADIRFIQQLLGHANLKTTEIYTHVSIRKLIQVHAETHPGAKLKPRGPVVEQ